MDDDRLERAQALLRYRFRDPRVLDMALTHPSYAAEHPGAMSYDRLEFLGDSVLGFVVSERLYRYLPDADEGELTHRKHHAVSGDALAAAAERLGLADLVLLGKGAAAAGERRRTSVLENVFEAVVGAIYLDGGLEAASDFVVRVLAERFVSDVARETDPKSALQQHTQASGSGLPEYRVTSTEGPPHRRTFTVDVLIDGVVAGTGSGRSKQAAEKAAASHALERLRDAQGTQPGS
jgi:ribonuclease-3